MTTYIITVGQSGSGITLHSGDLLVVSSGGTAKDIVVSSGGTEVVSSGGYESGSTISSGGTELVSNFRGNGGTAVGDTVASGGSLAVGSGGTITSTTFLAGADGTISSGGTMLAAKMTGGVVNNSGYDSGSTIGSTAQYGDYGTAVGDTVSGLFFIETGGSASNTVVASGGDLALSSGGVSISATVSSGGAEVLSGRSGAEGGTSIGDTILSGASLTIGSGGTATSTNISGGNFTVTAGGTAIGTVISNSTDYISSGGTLLGGTVVTGVLYMSGYQSGTTIKNNGTEGVYGTAVGVVDSGYLYVDPGGTVSQTVVSSGGYLGVQSGSTSISATVLSGGTEQLTTRSGLGGTSIDDTVSSGGVFIVGTGGVATGLTATGLTVYSGGTAIIQSGGSVAATTVDYGGSLVLESGAAIGGTTNVDSGLVVLSSGGTFTGSETLAGTNSNPAVFEFGPTTVGTITGVISGFTTGNNGDDIQFSGYNAGATVTAGNGTVTVQEGSDTVVISVAGVSAGEHLQLDANGFLSICFLEGTHILAEDGERKVETLRAGDMVATLRNGQQVLQPVKWVGHRSVTINGSNMDDAYPVRIRAGAFADAVPHRDLLITQEHCVFVDGKLIPARMLVNGRSIIVDRTISSYTYYHVELEQHGILLSEGLTTESYLDTGNRSNFANGVVQTLRADNLLDVAHKRWETDAAAPLTTDRKFVEPVWSMLAARAGSMGLGNAEQVWTVTDDPDLMLVTDAGIEVRPSRRNEQRYTFVVPANTSFIRVLSRAFQPSQSIGPFVDDRRTLGVKIGSVSVQQPGGRRPLTIDTHLQCTSLEGWSAHEDMNARWTTGAAMLPMRQRSVRPVVLELDIVGTGSYHLDHNVDASRVALSA